MTATFTTHSNKFCSDVPTQVQALSSSITGYQVTTGNSIGTVCGWDGSYMTDSRFPTLDGATSTKSFSYNAADLTGTLPTQFGLMTEATKSSISDNQLTGKRKMIFPPDSLSYSSSPHFSHPHCTLNVPRCP